MKRLFLCALFTLAGTAAWAGVVIEMEVTDSPSEVEAATDTIYADGKKLRIDPHESQGGGRMSMIFRDDELWILDHDKKRCQTIDKQGIEELSTEIGGAMKEMEAQLAKLPPDQRAMMEKMMK
ncbi:MAG: hypothetical protein OEM59_22335, partial [Rhodospirillales bacterium]|nr:hypothetical protein [Rhodospirillales bacterium]